ncbi:MAG: hypothetical protein LAT63_09725 [Marinobacter sp.]|nr:hypothetical protein [Marinobacter sp.]
MTLVIERAVGLSEERELEMKTGVDDLVIHWLSEFDEQKQLDPAGHYHLAPVVRWREDGQQRHWIPGLTFQADVTHLPWLRKLLGLKDQPHYHIDQVVLMQNIEKALMSSGQEGVGTLLAL